MNCHLTILILFLRNATFRMVSLYWNNSQELVKSQELKNSGSRSICLHYENTPNPLVFHRFLLQALLTVCWSGLSTTGYHFTFLIRTKITHSENTSNSASNQTRVQRMNRSLVDLSLKRMLALEEQSSLNTMRLKPVTTSRRILYTSRFQ